MNLVNQSADLISIGESNKYDMFKVIEKAGRTCYKSLDKITNGSAEKFVNGLIKSGHHSVLEHGTLYLYFEVPEDNIYIKFFKQNKYSVVKIREDVAFVTTNYRVLIENFPNDVVMKLMERMNPYSSEFEERITMHVVTNLQVAMEYLRHRVMSFSEESTRYCNYGKGKFNNELNFVDPRTVFPKYAENVNHCFDIWMKTNQMIEDNYLNLASDGCIAQECAQILPKDLKTELVMTGTESQWSHFFDLRLYGKTGAPHPQAKELAGKISDVMKHGGRI